MNVQPIIFFAIYINVKHRSKLMYNSCKAKTEVLIKILRMYNNLLTKLANEL